MKKLLSLVLSFTIIFSSITPALAQVQTPYSADMTRNIYNRVPPFLSGLVSEAMSKAMSRDQVKRELVPVEMQGNEMFVESVYTQYLAEYYRAYEQEVKDKAAGVRFCEKNQFGNDLRCVGNFESEVRWVFDGAKNEAAFYKAVKNGERYEVPIHMERPYYSDKTVEKHDLITFAHGVLRWTLNDLMKGKDKVAEEDYINWIYEVSHIVEIFDVATADRADLKKFLETILQNGNRKCNGANGVQRLLSGSKFVPIGTVEKEDQAAQKACKKLSEAVVLYGSMYANGEKGSAAASELIYQTVKDVYDENFGALVLQSGIGSLLMIDTPTSVNKIYELLMKDTVKELKWYASLKEILNLLSLEEWNKKGIAGVNAVRGGAGNYLNETGLQLQYVDKETAKAYGLSDFSISNAQEVISNVQVRYNLPYGNMLEDIGVMIASYKGNQTKGLVKRIQAAYLQNKHLYGTGNKLHMPLIVGIYSVLPKASVNKPLYEADWWDLNEGTQRRVNNLVGVPAGFQARTKDEAKMRRSLDNFKVQQLGFWADIISIAIFGGMLIASLPSIVRSAATLLRHVSRIRAIRVARIRVAGHGKVLDSIRSSLKARGITKQSIKTARAKAQAPVKGKPQANANATKTTKSTANAQGKPAQQARAQSRDVGQMPEEVMVEDAQGNAARYNVRTGQSVPVENGSVRTGTLKAEDMTVTVGEGGSGASGASGAARAAAEPVIPRPISAVAREEAVVADVEGIQAQVQGLRNGALKGKNVNTVYVERGGKYYDINGVEISGNYPDRSVVALTDGRLFIKNNGAWKNFGNWKGTGNIGGTRPWNLRMHDWWVNRQVGWQLTLENVKYGMRDMFFHPDHLVMGTSVPFATTARMASPTIAQVEMMQLGRTVGQLTRGVGSFGRTAQDVETLGRAAQGIEHTGQLAHTFGGLNGAMGGVLSFPIITRELTSGGYAVAPGKITEGLNASMASAAPVATGKETATATKETAAKENSRFSLYQKAVDALSLNATPQATKRAAAITIGMATAGMAVASSFGVNGLTTDLTIAGMSLLSGVGPLFARSKAKASAETKAEDTTLSGATTEEKAEYAQQAKQTAQDIEKEAGIKNAEAEAKATAQKTGLSLAEARVINIAKKAPLLAVLYSFMITGFGDFVSPAVALAKDTFGISQFIASLIPLAGFSMFAFSVPISVLQSKIGKVNVMKLGAATAAIGTALPMFFGMTGHFEATNISQFYAMLASIALICLGSTMLKSGASSIVADVSKNDASMTANLTRGDAIKGFPIAIGFIAPGVLPLLGFDWTALYPLYTAFFAGGLAVLSTIKIAEAKPEQVSSMAETFKVLKNKDIALLAAAGFAYIGAEIGVLSSTPVMLGELGISSEFAGTVAFLTTMLPIILARTFAPAILKRLGEDKTLISSTISALAGLGLVLTGNDIAALTGLVLTGLGYGNIFPILLGKAQKKDITKVNEITGVMLTAIVGGAFISPGMAALSDAMGIITGYIVPAVCISFIMGVAYREIVNGRGKGGKTGIDGAIETGIAELDKKIGDKPEGKELMKKIKAFFKRFISNPKAVATAAAAAAAASSFAGSVDIPSDFATASVAVLGASVPGGDNGNGTEASSSEEKPVTILANSLTEKRYRDQAKTTEAEALFQENALDALPEGFVEPGYAFRGMNLHLINTPSQLRKILEEGLHKEHSRYDAVFFEDNVEKAIGYAQQFRPFGHTPVLIKRRVNHTSRLKFADVAPEQISDVLVWAKKDDKVGWWKSSLNAQHQVILTYASPAGKAKQAVTPTAAASTEMTTPTQQGTVTPAKPDTKGTAQTDPKTNQSQAPPASDEELTTYGTEPGQALPFQVEDIPDLFPTQTPQAGSVVHIGFMSDTHGRMFSKSNNKDGTISGGIAAAAQINEQMRAIDPNYTFVTNGDEMGAPEVNDRPLLIARNLHHLRTDFATLGNHDLDDQGAAWKYILQFLTRIKDPFTLLATDVKRLAEMKDNYRPWAIKEYPAYQKTSTGEAVADTPVRIAFVGIAMEGPGTTDARAGNEQGMATSRETLNRFFAEMDKRGDIDGVVIMAHQSHLDSRIVNPQDNSVLEIIKALPAKHQAKILAVLGGHKHQMIADYPLGTNGPLFVEPGAYATSMATITLTFPQRAADGTMGTPQVRHDIISLNNVQLTSETAKEIWAYTEKARDATLDEEIVYFDGKPLTNKLGKGSVSIDATGPNQLAQILRVVVGGKLAEEKGISLQDVIGMSSSMNSGRATRDNGSPLSGAVTTREIKQDVPYTEFPSVLPITGKRFMEFVRLNIKKDPELFANFAYSDNVRVLFTLATDEEGNPQVNDVKEAQLAQLKVIINEGGVWKAIDPQKTYYVTALDHMLRGFFEGAVTNKMGLQDPIYRYNDQAIGNLVTSYYQQLKSKNGNEPAHVTLTQGRIVNEEAWENAWRQYQLLESTQKEQTEYLKEQIEYLKDAAPTIFFFRYAKTHPEGYTQSYENFLDTDQKIRNYPPIIRDAMKAAARQADAAVTKK